MKWRSKRWFCFVRIDQTYQPWHKWRSLPPCGPFLATSNISPNNKVNKRYNGQCSEIKPFATHMGQIWQINKAFHTTTSSGEQRQEWFRGRKGPSFWSIAQLTIQKEACGGETTGNALLKQQRERELDQGLCGVRDRSGRKASSRRRDSDDATAGTYWKCWKGTIDNHKAWNNTWGDVECYRKQSERSCMCQRSGGWRRRGWWWRRYRAWQAERG